MEPSSTEAESSKTRHLYNSTGRMIAFVVEKDVFDRSGNLVGQLVNDHEIRAMDGHSMGIITEGNRLIRDRRKEKRTSS